MNEKGYLMEDSGDEEGHNRTPVRSIHAAARQLSGHQLCAPVLHCLPALLAVPAKVTNNLNFTPTRFSL